MEIADGLDLSNFQPEVLIDASWLKSYDEEIRTLWWQVVQLNANLFIMERLSAFPFSLFGSPPITFWRMIYAGLYETCVMIIWRVAVDTDGKTLTLKRLKKEIISNLHSQYQATAGQALKTLNFGKESSKLIERIVQLRNRRFGHFELEWNVGLNLDQLTQMYLPLSDVTKVVEAINEFFEPLCFGKKLLVFPGDYVPYGERLPDKDQQSDIERLLDQLVRNSKTIRLPEDSPGEWREFRNLLTPEKLEAFNNYRRKFRLPEA